MPFTRPARSGGTNNKRDGIPVWCPKHFDPVFKSRETDEPINGSAATEFLLRRFIKDIRQSQTYKDDLSSGMTEDRALTKALANLTPICCLYEDDIPELLDTCRRNRLALTHPDFNDIPEERIVPIELGREN